MKKQLWVFIYIKYGKFCSVLLELFIKHKLLFSEECMYVIPNLFSKYRNEVCMLSIVNQNVTLARAGAVANYINKMAIFCGGRSLQGAHKDCKMYDTQKDLWSNFR